MKIKATLGRKALVREACWGIIGLGFLVYFRLRCAIILVEERQYLIVYLATHCSSMGMVLWDCIRLALRLVLYLCGRCDL